MARTIETIYEEMLDAFAEQRGERPEEGCDLAVRLYSAAAQVQALELQAEWVLNQSFPQTASGVCLDRHAETRGLERMPALAAEGVLRFSVDTAVGQDLTVEAGSVAMTAAGVRFATTEAAVLAAGQLSVDVAAAALEPGSNGNAAAGEICLMAVAPAGIKVCTNPQAFTGGRDQEADEALRQRILDSYRRLPNGANAAYYEQQALSFDQVAAAEAVGRPRGVGSVDVYITAQSGVPDEELLAQVEERLAAEREISVDLQVLAPETAAVNLQAELLPAAGWSFAQAKAAAEQALQNYFTGQLLGKGVTLAELGNLLYRLESVENYHLLAPAADLSGVSGQLPVLSGLTLTEMEGAQ